MADMKVREGTVDRILDSAQELIQARGYNGFSFRDVAADVGIRSASIHYHFPTKADLAAAVARRYGEVILDRLTREQAASSAFPDPLRACVAMFREALMRDGRMCLCGMLGAEANALPDQVAVEVKQFFARVTGWLVPILAEAAVGRPDTAAQLFLASLEGGLILAKAAGDVDVFDRISDLAIDSLGSPED